MADIVYTYFGSAYFNLTNNCNCRCVFCVRQEIDALGTAETLWHQKNPSWEEIKDAIDAFDFAPFSEAVFCGYGEPTCSLELLLKTAAYMKEQYPQIRLRLNTNGLGNLQNGRDIIPELARHIDAVSISLNAPDAETYNRVSQPAFPDAYDAMLAFAEESKSHFDSVAFTVVSYITNDEIIASEKIADEMGIPFRVRYY